MLNIIFLILHLFDLNIYKNVFIPPPQPSDCASPAFSNVDRLMLSNARVKISIAVWKSTRLVFGYFVVKMLI